MTDPRDQPDPTRRDPHGARPPGGPPPRCVGPYRVEGLLGRGGMGVVYRAFDERLHREVALKALPAEPAADPAERARLEREARALARVQHANVAGIFGLEESEGTLYLVLELVPGETLQARLDRGALKAAEALSLCAQVAAGLSAVHRKGLIHRDLKPGNVMITPEGVAKLLDFGLARRSASAATGQSTLTAEVAGTPGYMSPEQLRGELLDGASDVFAWGCLLYECLSGATPFGGRSTAERIAATLDREPEWERLPTATPAAVADLARACLSKDPASRPANMEVVRRLLEEARLTSGERRAQAALPKHFLPAERDAFVGREVEIGELGRLLDDQGRLVSLIGLGGTGKTRLVLHHARRTLAQWPGGAWFCDLSEARSVQGIVSAVATALDVPLGKDDPVVQLGHAIAGRGKCLVILDNFEQVARHAGETLGRWLDRCEEASFLVTTREVLGLPGEQALALAPLQQADAEALFVARARQARTDYETDAEEREVIARLVKLLDYLPLAIELAAARVRVMPAKQVLSRMGERFKLLSRSGARRDRQATLRATLDWSWDLLSDWEKSALAQSSVFEGGFTLEAAEAVLDLAACPEAPWAVDVVQALLDKSLLRRAGDERLDLLVSVQEYAAEKLDAMGGRAAAEKRHGAYFAAFGSEEALAALHRHRGVERRRALARELDNLVVACRRAVEREDAETAGATLRAAWEVLNLRGPFAAGEELAAAASRLALPAAVRANVDRVRGSALRLLGRGAEARACGEAALAICREVGNRIQEGVSLGNLGLLHQEQGRKDEARECLDAALAIAREVGNRGYEGDVLGKLAILHTEQGRMDEARECHDAALAIAREDGDRRSEGLLLGNLGFTHYQQGRMDEARAFYDAALAIHREVDDRHFESRVLGNLGILHMVQGRMDEARACYEAALAVSREAGDRRNEGMVLGNLGNLQMAQGRTVEARVCYDAVLAIAREIGDRRSEGIVLGNLGLLHLEQGRMGEARGCYEAALAIAREVGNRRSEGDVLGNLGSLHAEQGRVDEARACFVGALAIHREVGYRRNEGFTLGNLGRLHLEQGRMDEARACYDAGERLLRDVNDPFQLGYLLCGRARLEHAEGHPDPARAALAEAEALADRAGAGETSEFGRKLAEVRALLRGEGP